MNRLGKIEDKINEIMKEMEQTVKVDDEPNRKHIKTGFSYRKIPCPHCNNTLWMENLGQITAVIDADDNKHELNNLGEDYSKEEQLEIAQSNLVTAERAIKQEKNLYRETLSQADHIAQELTIVRKSITNNVNLLEADKEELKEALKKTVGSLCELEEESRELQRKIVKRVERGDG